MNKLLAKFSLIAVMAISGLVSANTAQATITGKIGIGTWDTQAEFDDIKVVKDGMTLYQSNFASNQTGWTTSGGNWVRQNGYFSQTGGGSPAMAWVGDTTWSDYTLTLKARKTGGNEGFLITVGAPGNVTNNWWNIGGWGNTKHNLQMPGVEAPDVAGTIATNTWYDIKVQLSGDTIKCYLNGALIHNTTRAYLITAAERTSRIQQILGSPGYQLLTPIEKTTLQELFNRNVYVGFAASDAFRDMPSSSAFSALSALEQLKIIRKVGAKRVTWSKGWGWGVDANRDYLITSSMDQVVMKYNSLGVFDHHVEANNDPNDPSAYANYGGYITFGQYTDYRVALHEMGHVTGAGTVWEWNANLMDGLWTGMYANDQVKALDGPHATTGSDGVHFGPYGMNWGNELYGDTDRRHVLMMLAFRRDMGLSSTLWMPTTTNIANGTYRLTPRNAQNSALAVLNANPNNDAETGIYTSNDSNAQQFLLDLQSDGTYRIRTALSGNRCLEMPGAVTDNGTQLKLYDDNGHNAQRWYFIPQDNGWFKIAPKNDMGKSIDINGGAGSTANGTAVQSWDYLDRLNQQWKLTPVTSNTAPVVSSVTLAPTSPVTNSQLKATYAASDEEKDPLTASYVWKKNGVVLSGENGDTLDLSKAGRGDKNDTLSVTVTVSDGKSSASKSASATVGNTTPSISSVSLAPTSPSTYDTLTATLVASDEDNDRLSYSYIWKKNNVVMTNESGATLDLAKVGNGDVGDSITVTAVANDGSANSTSVTSAAVKVALLANISPKVVSVLPYTVSDKVGAKRTFSVRVQDLNGTRDIESVWLLINDRLNWSEGATLIYVPSAASPAKGLLYLRQGDAFLPPVTVGEGTISSAVLDNGCVSIIAKEVGVEVVGSLITVTLPLTVKEGLAGKNTLFARVQDQQRTVDAASRAGDQGFIRCGTYDVTSSFVTPVKTAPTVGGLTPAALNTTLAAKTSVSAPQTFTVQVEDEEGASDLDTVWFMAGKAHNWINSATFVYVTRTRRLYLRSDNGQQWLGGGQIGSPGVLENSQVRLDLSKVTFSISADGKGLSVTLPLQAKSGLVGANKVWLRAQDIQGATALNGDDQGYVLGGNWNVAVGTTSKAPQPSNGNS